MSEETTPSRVSSAAAEAAETGELAALRREVIEARNLVIKSDNLLKNLHAELKQMGRKQEQLEKRHWMTSVVAYVLFAVMSMVAAFTFARAEIRASTEMSSQHEGRAKALQQELDKSRAQEQARREAADRASRVFEQLNTEKEGPGLNQAMSNATRLDRTLLSPMEAKAIDQRIESLRAQVAENALDRGQRAFRQQDWRTAATELSRYVELVPTAEAKVQYQLGNALVQVKDWAPAIAPLEAYLKAEGGGKTAQFAGYLLGGAYEETGNFPKAVEAYTRAVNLYPGSEIAPALRSKLRKLNASQGVLPAPTPTAPATGGAPAGGQPQAGAGPAQPQQHR